MTRKQKDVLGWALIGLPLLAGLIVAAVTLGWVHVLVCLGIVAAFGSFATGFFLLIDGADD